MQSMKIQVYGGKGEFSNDSSFKYFLEENFKKIKKDCFLIQILPFLYLLCVSSYGETCHTVSEELLDIQLGVC